MQRGPLIVRWQRQRDPQLALFRGVFVCQKIWPLCLEKKPVPAPFRIGFQPFPQSQAPFQFERQYPLSIGTVYTADALTVE